MLSRKVEASAASSHKERALDFSGRVRATSAGQGLRGSELSKFSGSLTQIFSSQVLQPCSFPTKALA